MGMSELGLENNAPGMAGAVPNSFATQMALATGGLKGFGGREATKGEDTDGMMGRLMLARMKNLEEGFAEVVKEFRGMRTAGNSSVENENLGVSHKWKGKERERAPRRKKKNVPGLVRTRSETDFSKVGMGLDGDKGKGKENVDLGNEGGEKDNLGGEFINQYMNKGSSL
jgi:hypothetical protein